MPNSRIRNKFYTGQGSLNRSAIGRSIVKMLDSPVPDRHIKKKQLYDILNSAVDGDINQNSINTISGQVINLLNITDGNKANNIRGTINKLLQHYKSSLNAGKTKAQADQEFDDNMLV